MNIYQIKKLKRLDVLRIRTCTADYKCSLFKFCSKRVIFLELVRYDNDLVRFEFMRNYDEIPIRCMERYYNIEKI